MKITGKLVGAETVIADLQRFDADLRARLKSEVLAEGMQVVTAARALARVRTGALRASIVASGTESAKAIIVTIGTDIKNGKAFYGRFLESGWTPNPKTKAAAESGTWKHNPRTAKQWRERAKTHGGRRIIAYPFLKPALAQLRGRFRERLAAIVGGARS